MHSTSTIEKCGVVCILLLFRSSEPFPLFEIKSSASIHNIEGVDEVVVGSINLMLYLVYSGK